MRAHTEASIAAVLTSSWGPFPYRRYLCVPNVSWGLLAFETDLAVLAPSNWLYDVEIKISVADLKRDREKRKHEETAYEFARGVSARMLFYAMPANVWAKVAADPPIVAHGGVIVIGDDYRCQSVRRPQTLKSARKATDAERLQLARLGVMRYWTRLSHKLDMNEAAA